ncbi:MAG TPA: TetR/AcrR family transcriptional regulator [Pseudonocardia sp.]
MSAALALIDEHGLGPFSIRTLAQRLGVAPMTIYVYFRTKEELLEHVRALVLDGVEAPLSGVPDWQDQVAGFARRFHHNLTAHPGLVDLVVDELPGPMLDPVRESVVRTLRGAGFSSRDAVDAVAVVFSYVLGFAVARRAQRATTSPGPEFPYLREAAAEYARQLEPDTFERGLADFITVFGNRRATG